MSDPADAFSPYNPAIVMLRQLRADPELRAQVAARIGAPTTDLDEDSFLQCALEFEPPRGNA